jgi:hypothetical protein
MSRGRLFLFVVPVALVLVAVGARLAWLLLHPIPK